MKSTHLTIKETLKVGSHVRVRGVNELAGKHPQQDRTGIITEFMGIFTSWGTPRAMVKFDGDGRFGVVSLIHLVLEP